MRITVADDRETVVGRSTCRHLPATSESSCLPTSCVDRNLRQQYCDLGCVKREREETEQKLKLAYLLRDLSPQANYTDRATAACRRS
jgi:hypothetical protein